MDLDLSSDSADLTASLVDVESVSGGEADLAAAIERALSDLPHLSVHSDGNAVVARTTLGRPQRVILAGHIDTVPIERNGLLRLARHRPDLLHGDLAVLMEPTGVVIEGGCQGTMRAEVTTRGKRAHSARSWMGLNAIHAAGGILDVLRSYQPRQPEVDGLTYHEGLNAVGIGGGVAGNVIPDECVVTVNYRFAPDRSEAEAAAYVREVFSGYEVEITDSAPGARPGLDHPAAATLLAAVAGVPRAKFGWTDVARFALLGMPALNYGPGDPMLAHSRDEHVPVAQIAECEATLEAWLTR